MAEGSPSSSWANSLLCQRGRRPRCCCNPTTTANLQIFFFFLHGRTEESLSPGATSPRLLDALSFIQCEIAAINPALREAYHSGAFFFLLTRLVRQALIQFHRPSVRQSERRLSQEKLVKITLRATHGGLCRHAHGCKGRAPSHARPRTLAGVGARACLCVCSVSTQGHTQAYSSAISQSRNKHRHDNSDARFGQDHSK